MKTGDYMERLDSRIAEYMELPVTERSVNAIYDMLKCRERVSALERRGGTFDAADWNRRMINDDGTRGGKWTTEQTSSVAKSMDLELGTVSAEEWNAAMNMMYSDYCTIAEKYGVSTPGFYADMAHAFLFDKDGGEPVEKLKAYYRCIVRRKGEF